MMEPMSAASESRSRQSEPFVESAPRMDREPRVELEPRMDRAPRPEREGRPEREPRMERAPEPRPAEPVEREPRMDRSPRPEREEREPRIEREVRTAREPREERMSSTTATMEGPAMSNDELAAEGRKWTEQFLQAMGFEATVTATAAEDHVDVTAAVGADDELLTGRKGEVRQALQHLLNRMINRGEGSRYHLQLEINDFWKKREDELRALASSLATEALEGGKETVTEYLNAQERRIVHMTLKEDDRVKTYALGTGMIKRVAIAPADFEAGPRDDED